MCAVRCTKRVVDVKVLISDEFLHERRVIGGLAWVETQVVEQFDARCEFSETTTNWLHRILRIGSTLRTTEMRARGNGCAARRQILDRGKCSTNTEVVDDLTIGDRHIEISA
jgi:hypothetical protein